MIKGAIFDIDGVLLDSMGIWDDLGARYLQSIGKIPEEGLNKILFSMQLPTNFMVVIITHLKKLFSLKGELIGLLK